MNMSASGARNTRIKWLGISVDGLRTIGNGTTQTAATTNVNIKRPSVSG